MPTDEPLKIAFSNICNREWVAGCHYLENLFRALQRQPVPPQCYLLRYANDSADADALTPYLTDVLRVPARQAAGARLRLALQRRTGAALRARSAVGDVLHAAGVDALFTLRPDEAADTPSLVWIPDFQHVHLPHLFTSAELRQRTENYQRWSASAGRIIVSSQPALADLHAFASAHAHKGRVLHFVAGVDEAVYAQHPAFVCAEYHLPQKFFYLPNQFWQHKNHSLVIDALARLRDTHPHITVVCTGNPHDYRQPRYFSDLLGQIARAGVQRQMIVLGMIPHAHIFALIRQAVAVLQPSRFEGWNTSIEEVKSLGKAMIVSDIAVHREQDPPQSLYVAPDDAAALARHLVTLDETRQAGPDIALEAQARAALPERQRAFGAQFMAYVREIVPS